LQKTTIPEASKPPVSAPLKVPDGKTTQLPSQSGESMPKAKKSSKVESAVLDTDIDMYRWFTKTASLLLYGLNSGVLCYGIGYEMYRMILRDFSS
jgi:hypothetical protein